MALQTQNLSMIGLGMSNNLPSNSIQPKLIDGIHLRWAFKPERGFPWYGYYLFRRKHGTPDLKLRLDLTNFQIGLTKMKSDAGELSSDSDLVLSDFPPVNPTRKGFDLSGRKGIEFTPSSLVYWIEFDIGFFSDTQIDVTAYLGKTIVQQVQVKDGAHKIVTVKLQSDAISSINFDSGQAVLLQLKAEPVTVGTNWQPAPDFPNPICLPVAHPNYPCITTPQNFADAETMAFSRVFYGTSSHWQGQNFKDLYDQLYILTDGKSQGIPMGEIYDVVLSVNKQPYMPRQYPLDLVLIGAINPAIAQMVGLYWIDQPGTLQQDPNFTTTTYDYMLVADHKDVLKGRPSFDPVLFSRILESDPEAVDVFIVYNQSMAQPPTPLEAPGALKAYALPTGAIQTITGSSLPTVNNAGLRWEPDLKRKDALQSSASIMYHIWRSDLGNSSQPRPASTNKILTINAPVLVADAVKQTGRVQTNPKDWPPERLYYIDSGLAEGWYSYQVSGIDIFGRHSMNSAPSPWLQWLPKPDPLPWYFKDPPPADNIVHPSAVNLKDVAPPPAPTAVEAYALDPADPTVLKDTAYNNWYNDLTASSWYQALPESEKKNLIGLRVRWRWTHAHMRQAPDTKEFRIYFHPDYPNPVNTIAGSILTVATTSGSRESTVQTNIADTQPQDAYAGKWLQSGTDAFKILSSNPVGGSLSLKIAHIGPNKDIKPALNTTCILTLPEDHPAYVDYTKTDKWQERFFVNDFAANVITRIIPVPDSNSVPLEGVAATVTANQVKLDGSPGLSVLTLLGEHIFLEGDTNRPDKTYQIIAADDAAKTVTMNGTPLINSTVTIWSIGFPERVYEVFLPTIDNTSRQGLPLLTSSGEPITYAYITVSAADATTFLTDKRTMGRWAKRPGNEGPAAARAKIFRVHRELPVAPQIPAFNTEKVFATKADYHSRSFYTFRWIPIQGLKTHIFRALDYSVFQVDWETRSKAILSGTPVVLSETDPEYFPPELLKIDPIIDLRRSDLIIKINALNNIAPATPFNEVMDKYDALSDDALRVLAALPGNEAAFTQLTIQALDQNEPDPEDATKLRWRNRVGPDNPSDFIVEANQLSYINKLDGRSVSRHFYRAGSVDGAHNRSANLSFSSPPVYCPDVVPPKPPVLLQALGGSKVITLQWMENIETDLDCYELYQTENLEATRDYRLMNLYKKIAKSPGSTLRTGEVAPSSVLNESGVVMARRLKLDDIVPANQNLYYLLIAVDVSRNRSEPSQLASGRAYQPPPDSPNLASPVWDTTELRVRLSWSSDDLNLESRVERRKKGETTWIIISRWLPRGIYTYLDELPDFIDYEYRIKVRDIMGQVNF